ncbi:hypothetical protein [Mycoplasma sp. SG1]|uniref:hypothetical protein n=1 Tax=Mycoplasma sp. SG1 TaxID=2810348 RepID=UPI002024C3CB|nr:hypothetical protein [Mycoplasma sp. SG1]URM53091.1 hypothetical protein JRW51_01955 [Mycoplasma sp. SG1]
MENSKKTSAPKIKSALSKAKNTSKKTSIVKTTTTKKTLSVKGTKSHNDSKKSPKKIKISIVDDLTYVNILSFLTNFIKNNLFYHLLVKNTTLQDKISELLGFLNFFEEKLNIKEDERFFFKLAQIFSKILNKDLEINTFESVESKLAQEEVNTVKTFLLNLIDKNIDKDVFDKLLKTDEINEILLNFKQSPLLEDDEIVKTNVSVSNLPSDADVQTDLPVPTRRDLTPETTPNPTKPFGNQKKDPFGGHIYPNNKYIKYIVKTYPDVYPFQTKPKIILLLKRLVASFALLGFCFLVAFVWYSLSQPAIKNVIFDIIKTEFKSYGKITESMVPGFLGGFIIYWCLYMVRALWGFLFLPKTESAKYYLPLITPILAIILAAFLLFNNINLISQFHSDQLTHLVPKSQRTIFYTLLSLSSLAYFASACLLLTALVKRPKPESLSRIHEILTLKNYQIPIGMMF